MATTDNQVAEMQGLYGPFTITERVVQKIWLRGDFARDRAVLTDGRKLEIRSTGAWNLLGGPDFRGARVVIDGRETIGDIEVHFHAADWRAHGHAADRAYDNVALHVVLFPPADFEQPAVRGDGRELPTLVLLPLLHRDLEEYAGDDALEIITARDEWERFAGLAAMPPAALHRLILGQAWQRWQQKTHFAKQRIGKLGWTAAVHHTALEILGYRQNRATMLMVAARHPLEEWGSGPEPEAVFEQFREAWMLQGVRPANHPRTRLRQYQHWAAARPDWPQRLLAMAGSMAAGEGKTIPTQGARQALGLKKLRETIADDLMDHAVSGSRLDNLVCDGFLPLAAAQGGGDLFALWHHWFLGDVPAMVRKALPKLGLAGQPGQPLCHGRAQGLLGWILACEARASC
jgi:hypothetical protein